MATIISLNHHTSVLKKQPKFTELKLANKNKISAEIIIFPGIRIERISAENKENQENQKKQDKLSKFECQL